MKISFDGTNFFGWQIQPEFRTVQGEIEAAISSIFDRKVSVNGSSRTDTGVHALGMIAHADFPERYESEDLRYRLNAVLPLDIAIVEITPSPDDFHARFWAKGKRYEYRLVFEKIPHLRNYTHRIDRKPDIGALNALCRDIIGDHDFTAFARIKSVPDNPKCSIRRAEWFDNDYGMAFVIDGDRFLHTMVRSIVGAMLDCERGLFAPDQFAEMLETGIRKYNYAVAPGCGLWLVEVFYD